MNHVLLLKLYKNVVSILLMTLSSTNGNNNDNETVHSDKHIFIRQHSSPCDVVCAISVLAFYITIVTEIVRASCRERV